MASHHKESSAVKLLWALVEVLSSLIPDKDGHPFLVASPPSLGLHRKGLHLGCKNANTSAKCFRVKKSC